MSVFITINIIQRQQQQRQQEDMNVNLSARQRVNQQSDPDTDLSHGTGITRPITLLLTDTHRPASDVSFTKASCTYTAVHYYSRNTALV